MSEHMERCEICDWPLAESADKGCVAGNCSYRPQEGTAEWYRIEQRRADLRSKERAAAFSDAIWNLGVEIASLTAPNHRRSEP